MDDWDEHFKIIVSEVEMDDSKQQIIRLYIEQQQAHLAIAKAQAGKISSQSMLYLFCSIFVLMATFLSIAVCLTWIINGR